MGSETYDVFLSHNSRDKSAVRELKGLLCGYQTPRGRQIKVWLDVDMLRPGLPWQDGLEQGIRNSRSVAVLIGDDGIGPWEDEEMQATLVLAVRDKRPVIPVLLPGAPSQPELPMFLGNRTWVDLRGGFTEEGLDNFVFGITGKRLRRIPPTKPTRTSEAILRIGAAVTLPPSKFDLPKPLVTAVANGTVVPFVGSGVSLSVSAEHFPSWPRLLQAMADKLEERTKREEAKAIRALLPIERLFEAAKIAEEHLQGDFARVVKATLGHKSPPDGASLDLPDAIWNLRPALVLTTNYDRVLQWNDLQPDVRCNDDDELVDVMTEPKGDSPWIWHVHGHVERGNTLIVSPKQYEALYGSPAARLDDQTAGLACLESVFRDRTVLFIGFGLQDRYVMETIRRVLDRFNRAGRTHFALMKAGESDSKALWSEFQIQTVTYQKHGEVALLLKQLASTALGESPRSLPNPPPAASPDRESENFGVALGKITDLISVIKSKYNNLTEDCREQIRSEFESDFRKRKKKAGKFVDWLIKECPATEAVSRLNGIAREPQLSARDRTNLKQISSHLIPLRYAPEVVQRIREQLASNTFEIVTGNIGNFSIAEIIMAACDAKAIRFEAKIGASAFEFQPSGDYGYGPEAIEKAVIAFFKDILACWETKFGPPKVQSTGSELEDLARQIKSRIKTMQNEKQRTVYCLLKRPEESAQREELEEILRQAAAYVPNLVLLEVDGRYNENDEDFLELPQPLSRIAAHDHIPGSPDHSDRAAHS